MVLVHQVQEGRPHLQGHLLPGQVNKRHYLLCPALALRINIFQPIILNFTRDALCNTDSPFPLYLSVLILSKTTMPSIYKVQFINRQHLLHRHSVNGEKIYSIYDSISIES
jgi:hypothetical protein